MFVVADVTNAPDTNVSAKERGMKMVFVVVFLSALMLFSLESILFEAIVIFDCIRICLFYSLMHVCFQSTPSHEHFVNHANCYTNMNK